MKSSSARISAIKNTVVSRGFKVQKSNTVAATSNARGVVPCILNFDQLVYTTLRCQTSSKSCNNNPSEYTAPALAPTYSVSPIILAEVVPTPVQAPRSFVPAQQSVRRNPKIVQGGTPTSSNIFSSDGGSPFKSNYGIQDGGGP